MILLSCVLVSSNQHISAQKNMDLQCHHPAPFLFFLEKKIPKCEPLNVANFHWDSCASPIHMDIVSMLVSWIVSV